MISQTTKSGFFTFSPAPHIHSGDRSGPTIFTFVAALLPAVVFGIMTYGMDAVRVISISVSSAMAFEWIIEVLFKQEVTVSDGSAMLTGLLFALIIPASVPWWLILVGTFMAIMVGKHIFGGFGGNPFNPVLIGWAMVRISWPDYLNFNYALVNYDLGFSIEYPLSLLKASGAEALGDITHMQLFLGQQPGGIGSVYILLLLAGGLFLILRGVISWRVPLFFIAGAALTASIFYYADGVKYADPLFHILTGNIMIGAFFLSTDYPGSPVNRTAMVIFGLSCGILTIIFRTWSVYVDGVVFSLLIMNILNPLLDKIKPAVVGKIKEGA